MLMMIVELLEMVLCLNIMLMLTGKDYYVCGYYLHPLKTKQIKIMVVKGNNDNCNYGKKNRIKIKIKLKLLTLTLSLF